MVGVGEISRLFSLLFMIILLKNCVLLRKTGVGLVDCRMRILRPEACGVSVLGLRTDGSP